MKYLITSVILAIVILVTIDAKKRPGTTTTIPTPEPWKKWNGNRPYKDQDLAKQALSLYNDRSKKQKRYKFKNITLAQKREISDTDRYRVKFFANECRVVKLTKGGKNDKKKRPDFLKCTNVYVPFQTIFTVGKSNGYHRLNVTNLETRESYFNVYKVQPRGPLSFMLKN